jgi:hypothetical protein
VNDTLFLALLVVALVLAAVDLVRSKGQALTSWAVVALAAALLLGRL